MGDIKKQIIYYTITFVVAFFLGVLFDHYVLCSDMEVVEEASPEVQIELKGEEESENEGEYNDGETGQIKEKTVNQEDGCTMYIDVSGALRNPGVYCLESDALIVDAVNRAGGFTKDAASKFINRRINLAQPLVNNQKLYFPFQEELVCELKPLLDEGKKVVVTYEEPVVYLPTTEPYIDQNPATTTPPDVDSPGEIEEGECVNINTASKDELITLSGVGESTAEKIIQGRPYEQVEDLLDVSGIGEVTLANIEAMVCI
jgi:competence protein ComEA